MRTIPLHGKKARGRVALVDDEDYELVSQYRWIVQEGGNPRPNAGPYAATVVRIEGRRLASFRMHKLITGWPLTDHVDHDGLNNQRSNLRPATRSQNSQNQLPERGGSSRYKGVCWDRQLRKWRTVIKVDGRQRRLGDFVSEIEAACAYDAAARELFGEFACMNFPEAPTQAMRERWAAEREKAAIAAAANGARIRSEKTSEQWKRREPDTRTCVRCGAEYQSRAVYSFYCGYRCRRSASVERARERRAEARAGSATGADVPQLAS